MREDFVKSGSVAQPNYVPGVLRKLILRLQPYLTPKTRPAQVCVKGIQIFSNSAAFLADRQIFKDKEHEAFSTADDPDNVHIPCALSLLSYELYPSILAILGEPLVLENPSPGKKGKHYESQANTFGLQHKIHIL